MELISVDQEDPDSEVNNNNSSEDDQDIYSFEIIGLSDPSSDLSLSINPLFGGIPSLNDIVDFNIIIENSGPNDNPLVIVENAFSNCISIVSISVDNGDYASDGSVWQIENLNLKRNSCNVCFSSNYLF